MAFRRGASIVAVNINANMRDSIETLLVIVKVKAAIAPGIAKSCMRMNYCAA
jgi:hypothetical protein